MHPIIGLSDWFQTPPGRYLLAWERSQCDAAVADIFGYHALQLGLPELDTLGANRMPHRWLAVPDPLPAIERPGTLPPKREALVTDFAALPFPAHSLDLLVLPHALEFNGDPHATLREVERVLVPEGRVVICGLNPVSLWGLRQRRAQLYRRLGFGEMYLPEAGDLIGYWRLRDWLRLLSFEVESVRFGAYRPAVMTEKWLERFEWMDTAGARWWPIFGAVYFLVAVKRVRGLRLLGPPWKPVVSLASAPATATQHSVNKSESTSKESVL
jgi:SAM-dependent methyltransferase